MPEPTVFNGRFELHRRLGRGGMAEVFLARDLQLDRPVAVKVLFPAFANDPNFVARFRREAQAAANLNHPNIVSVFDWGQEHGTYFIVMEYVEGRSLADVIRAEGTLPGRTAVDIATDVAAALGAAHTAGVLHRDIKPGNILVTPTGLVKVADWGIGRALDAGVEENLTQTGAVMGTATYFSPEQAQGLPLDPRSDLYALGVVLYEMVTGRPPFQGDSPVSIAYKHVQEQPRPPRSINLDVPPELEAIILQLLAKRPEDRYDSADELRADLRRFREGFRVHAHDRAGAAAADATAIAATAAATAAVPPTRTGYAAGPPVADDDAYVRPPSNRSGAFVFVLIVLLAVLAGALYLLGREVLDIGGEDEPTVEQVEVPDVVNQPAAEARAILENQDFIVLEEPEDVAEASRVGIVVNQNPGGGIRVDQGSEITIIVGAQDTRPMPDLVGSTPDQAESSLRGLEFTGTINQQEVDDDDVEAGLVARTEPAANEPVALNGTITLFVSGGPAASPVPTCDNLTESDCVTRIDGAGLNPQPTVEPSPTILEGRVIRTEPAAGTEVEPGTSVRVVVSSGPAPTTTTTAPEEPDPDPTTSTTGVDIDIGD